MNERPGRWPLKLLAAASLLAAAGAGAAVPPGAAAEILNLQGTGEQRPAAAADWRPARPAQPLAAGDYVRTREDSRMALLFADETQVRLHANSVLQVKTIAGPTEQATDLLLQLGRAWAQTRRPPGTPLNLHTPAATAGIRGTDWDIEVGPDGRTQLTVLSGEVRLANAQGEVTVGRNEAAIAEVGKAPVKILLSHPRDRIQWVNALQPQPERFAGVEPASVREALVRADRLVAEGENARAIALLQQALAAAPGQPLLRAQLARAQLLADRVADSALTLGEPRADDPAPLWLARGALARRAGDAPGTLSAYGEAVARAPADDRGWFGLGSAHTEREDAAPARAALLRALALNPHGAGYRGELGTLETFRNDLPQAQQAFAAALQDHPGDYVALTGLGLLRLKQGEPQAALDAFLRAGVMEPRYARARTYTGVAYWQLGRHQDAIVTLRQAAGLDDKDPLPWLFLAQIHADLFRAGEAVEAARAALVRLPYLKSLNQVANDQQGRANLGAALAFFGMEDWALELAQQSYHPYWGGSHLFLADRYPGEFDKNSELFQGFLADPLAFGGSQRFSSLVQQPGHHGALGLTVDKETFKLASPYAMFNGLVVQPFPLAYFVKAQSAVGTRMPIDASVRDTDARLKVGTLGLGARPTPELGLFAYYNDLALKLAGRNAVPFLREGDLRPTTLDGTQRQGVVGASWRGSPVAQTWAKFAYSEAFSRVDRYPTPLVVPPVDTVLGLAAEPRKRLAEAQLRHTQDFAAGRLTATLEHVKERQSNTVFAAGPVSGTGPDGRPVTVDTLLFAGVNDIDRRYSGLTLGWQQALAPALQFDGQLAGHWIRHRVHGQSAVALVRNDFLLTQRSDRDDLESVAAPRLGLVWQPSPALTVRAAYQHWVRPLSTSTLAPVQTAGIAMEDRLLEAGGQQKRTVLQAAWTPDADSFVGARLDHIRFDNPVNDGVDLRTPSLPFLEELRNAQLVNLSSLDLLEGDPLTEQGRLSSATVVGSRMLGRRFSAYARYAFQHGTSGYFDSNAGAQVSGRAIPYVPRHTFALGGTWASAARVYLSARAVYRSGRYTDATNGTRWGAGWGLDLAGFWESADKHWVIGAGAIHLGGPRDTRQLVVDARYRF